MFDVCSHLLPMSKAFKSEEIVKKSANPVYLQTFFIPLNSVSLLDFCLEIGVFSVSGGSTAGTTSLKTFLGGVRLSDGTGESGFLSTVASFRSIFNVCPLISAWNHIKIFLLLETPVGGKRLSCFGYPKSVSLNFSFLVPNCEADQWAEPL